MQHGVLRKATLAEMNRWLVVLILIGCSQIGFGQSSLPTVRGTWFTRFVDNYDEFESTTYYRLEGDTVVSGQPYKKLRARSSGGWGNWWSSGSYIGALRDSNHVVYFLHRDSAQSHILYDFNLEVGDTVNSEIGINNYSGIIPIVQGVDSIELADGFHKRIYFDNSELWVEGVGNPIEFLTPVYGTSLSCCITEACMVSLNEYSYGYGETCPVVLDVPEDIEGRFVKVIPNPLTHFAQIRFEVRHNFNELKVYDIRGILIKQEDISGLDSYTLNRDQLPAGIYFLRLSSENGQLSTAKVVVQ